MEKNYLLLGASKHFRILLLVLLASVGGVNAQNAITANATHDAKAQFDKNAVQLGNNSGGQLWARPDNSPMPAPDPSTKHLSKGPSNKTKTNFTAFSELRKNMSSEVNEYNKGFENDPELGALFPNAPCSNCYELLEKRTANQKYFVEEGSGTQKFILQSSQYPVHYKDAQGRWRTIAEHLEKDNAHAGQFGTKGRDVNSSINAAEGYTTLSTDGGSMQYNNDLELVYVKPNGTEQSLGKINWSNYTAGDDGLRVKNAWPGVDMEVTVLMSGMKTNFSINAAMPAYAAGKLLLRDHMKLGKGLQMAMPKSQAYAGVLKVNNAAGENIFRIQPALAYEQNNAAATLTGLNYMLGNDNVLDIEVPGNLLNKAATSYPLIIDPLATGTVVSGFTYSAFLPPALPGTGYCTNTTNVAIPAAATLTDIQVTYNYYGPFGALWSNSRIGFQINGLCSYTWLSCGATASSGIPGGTCGLTNSTFWSAGPVWSGCVPAFSCTAYNLPFQILLSQNWSNSGVLCDQSVFATANGYTVNVFGSAAILPSIAPPGGTTLCMPATLPLTGAPAGGVWSSSAPGVATVPGGVVTGVSNGTTTISYTVSGCSATKAVTVGTTPTVTGSTSICFPGSTVLTGTPGGGAWSSTAPGVATVTGGTVNAVSIGTTIISYNTGTCSAAIPVDVNSPTAVAPTTQPTGLSFSSVSASGAIVNFTPNGSTGYLVIASTSPTLSSTPVTNVTYATGSSFGGGIVINGSTSGSAPAYSTSLLNSNTKYYIFVYAFNNNCAGPQYITTSPLTGNFSTCIIVPGTPVVGTIGVNTIALSWAASPVGGGFINPVNYTVSAYLDATLTTMAPGYPVSAGIATSYVAGFLGAGVQYWFTVSAVDACATPSGVATAATNCTGIASIPYLQTFEVAPTLGNHNPNCMTSNVQNCVLAGTQTPATLGSQTNHTLGGSYYYNFGRQNLCSAGWNNQWLLTPGLAMTAGTTYTMSLWYRTDAGDPAAWTLLKMQASTNNLVPPVGSATMGGVPVTIGSVTNFVQNTGYAQFLQTFTVPTSGVYYVGIDGQSGGADAVWMAIDDIEICAVPTAAASNATAPYCAPATVNLTSTLSTSAVGYSWSGPSGYTSTLANPLLSSMGAGIYTYTLSAINDPIPAGYGGICTASVTTTFTVNPTPAAITGPTSVCISATITLNNTTTGGTWSSGSSLVTVGAATGSVMGMAAGTATITYTLGTGCIATYLVTVNTAPSAIGGIFSVCTGATTALSNSVLGGTWTSTVPGVATVSATGVVSGLTVGTTTISYSLGGACVVWHDVTVNLSPAAITGTAAVCLGLTTVLTDPSPGGTWTSSAPGTAAIDVSGTVSAIAVGFATITYTLPGGCYSTIVVTVNPNPGAIGGTLSVCSGLTTALTNGTAGGAWAMGAPGTGTGSIGSSSGVLTGGATAGTTTITYTLSTGCKVNAIATINTVGAITGVPFICVGLTATLGNPVTPGTWSSGSIGIATVDVATGVVTGNSPGTAVITYTTSPGCVATIIATVNASPAPVTGTLYVCTGLTTTLADATAGGTWSSSATGVATVGAAGDVTGVALGTARITYSLGAGCISTAVVTVNTSPAAITGPILVCAGSTITLADATTGGTWTSSPGATVGGATGIVTGASGTPTISYTLPSIGGAPACFATMGITVNPLPAAIVGVTNFCQGTATTFTNTSPSGTWSCNLPLTCSIDATTGIATALLNGTVIITYTLPTGCIRTKSVVINPAPAAIGGALAVCESFTTTLTDVSTPGTWTSSTPGIASVGLTNGVVTGAFAGNAVITYTLNSTGCYTVAIVTVNPSPSAIGGTLTLCPGTTTNLSNTVTGGTWSSVNTTVATIDAFGVVSGLIAGTSVISYVSTTGCYKTAIVTVNPLPAAIGGTLTVCPGYTTTLTDVTGGGTWSSSTTGIATIGASNGVVLGVASGTSTITYTVTSSGCLRTAVVTVNSSPAAIGGPASVCIGYTTTLTDATIGGTWSIGAPGTASATIGASNGVVTAGSPAGTITVTYTAPVTGCMTTIVVTVNSLPGAITGTTAVCEGLTTTLANSVSGGTWSSGSGLVSVGSSTGAVTGVSAGTATVSYTIGSGCYVTTVVTVNPLPAAISGTPLVCVGSTVTLSDATPLGTWASSATGNATIGSSTGIVTGVSGISTTIITYKITATGCLTTMVVSVNPVPANITGVLTICPGTSTTLADATAGGAWSSASPNVTVDAPTGGVLGVSAGTAVVTYMLSSTGCFKTTIVTVNPTPGAIGGTMQVCVGSATLLTCAGTGTWSAACPGILTIAAASGIASGVGNGVCTVTYTLNTGCIVTAPVTVNPLPAAITGVLTVCPGTFTTLADASTPGTWSTAIPLITINSSTGVVGGIAAGNATVTYTLPTTCRTTAVVTVNPLPTAITGPATVCPGTTTLLTGAPTGGTWSSGATGTATIGVSSGIVTGVSAGTVTDTYTLPTGCQLTKVVTVNPLPAPISGATALCVGLSTTLSDATTGGTWLSSTPANASVGNTTGIVTGNAVGTATISYVLTATGCYVTSVMNVNGLPPAITGTKTLCPGTTTTLFDAASGGTWTSGTPANATIDVNTGIVSGIAAGTTIITYTIGTGCTVTTVVTVNPLPAPISGSPGVCIGFTTTLTNVTSGGTWSSSNTSVAPIGSTTGIVSGNAVGTSTITYTLNTTGCYITAVVTVNPLPASITGSAGFCNLTTTTLADASAGGTWASTNTAVGTIDPVSGAMTGISVDTVTIIYTLPTGCYTTKLETIILAPYAIAGPSAICEGSTITLTNPIVGGTWSSSAPAYGSVDIATGIVDGVSAGNATITYVLSTGCFSTQAVTVNVTPAAITGNLGVCYGLSTTLHNATPGGTWSSTNPAIAPVLASGVVNAVDTGTSTISYTMSTGCNATAIVTVFPLPLPITGTFDVCLGLTTTLSDASAGGTWNSASPSVAAIDPLTGVVAGLDIGVATINYTLSTGCTITQDVTVNPLPPAISGTLQVCIGLSVTLIDTPIAGTWSSSDPGIAYIDASGVVTGMSAGTATITYMVATGCVATVEMTVNGLPPAITGNLNVCAGFTSNLGNAIPGGNWTTDAGSAGIGTINNTTGVITGISPGTMNITYTLPSGCTTTAVATVNVLPSPLTGNFRVCEGSTTSLSDPDAGGTWSSSNPAVGTVDLITGVVTGIASGVVDITYTFITTGCINKAVITVNPLPAPITGQDSVCEGSTITLHDVTATGAGGWTSSLPSVGSFADPFSGVLLGVSAGVTTVSYSLPITGCTVTKDVKVNPRPSVIAGPSAVCLGTTVTLSSGPAGGTWSSFNSAVAPVSATGVVTGLSVGTSIITYVLSTGCLRTQPMVVNQLPALHTVTGGGHYCAGGNGVSIGLDGSDIGISYALHYGPSATGYLAGTGAAINFGLHTVAGVYSVIATNAITGCNRTMTGTVPVIIDPSVTPMVTIVTSSGTDTVCQGAPTVFIADTVNGGTSPGFVWKVNGTTVSTTVSYSFVPADGDLVTVRVSSNAHCAVPALVYDTMKVTVLPVAVPVATISINPGDTVCEYTPVTFTAGSSYGGYGAAYRWFVNSISASTGPVYTYIPNNGDVISVRLVSNYQCRLADSVMSTNATMAVQPMTIPHVDIVTYPGLAVAAGEKDSLATIVYNAGTHPTYQWYMNSIPVPGATNAYYIDTFQDYDSVACVVTSSDVCHGVSSFDWVFITIHATGVGVTTNAAADLRLQPNPNKGTFSVIGSLGATADQEVTMEVTDMLGQIVYKNLILAKRGRMDERVQLGANLANGMYMLSLKAANLSKVFHFVVEQ